MANVLIVDDEPQVLRSFKRVLEASGHAVDTAPDGQSALDLLSGGKGFDVILSDVRMPKMSGTHFLKAIRQHDAEVPVILLSAAPSLESALDAVAHGALRYLRKPLDFAEL